MGCARRTGAVRLLAVLAAIVSGSACAATSGTADGSVAPSQVRPTAFRVRAATGTPLNLDTAWLGALNEGVGVLADRPFRLRFEVEDGRAGRGPLVFRLQVRWNGGAWADVAAADFPYPDEIASPRVSVVEPSGYAGGAATADLLPGSLLPFRAGTGVGLDSLSPPWPSGEAHGEWEWTIVIRRYADGAVTNDAGDRFEFRMVESDGRLLGDGPSPTITLAVPPRLLGGTFVETPGRLGPWQASDASRYFVMEPAETFNVLMVVRSTDGGETWIEADGDHRPAADDLEGFATAFHAGRIHMLHQTSSAVWHHAFGTAHDPASPDRWVARDELVARPAEPPTQVAALAARPDGSLVGVYGDSSGLRYRIRAADGTWSPEHPVDGPAGFTLSGPHVVSGMDGEVHLVYTARNEVEGSVWARRIASDGTLRAPQHISGGVGTREEDAGAVAPPVYLAGSRSLVILYRLADGGLWERRVETDGGLSEAVRVSVRRVAQSAVDSDQVGADAIANGETVHVLFIDEDTGDLLHAWSPGAGEWTEGLAVGGIDAQWVRGNLLRGAAGEAVYGFVYDAGSHGGSGMNWYSEIPVVRGAPAARADD